MKKMPEDKYTPPRLARRFLRWYCRAELLDEVEGDLAELFERRAKEQGLFRARLRYCLNVLMFLHPDYIRKRKKCYSNNTAMFRQNMLLALRNFSKYRSSFMINLLGLSSGLACAALIFMWVSDELSIDKFHTNEANLYQVLEESQNAEGSWVGEYSSGLLGETLQKELPEVKYAVPYRLSAEGNTISTEEKHIRGAVLFAGKEFFNTFSFSLAQGSPNQVLSNPDNMVISKAMAQSLFGNDVDVVGKAVEYNQNQVYQVSGVFEGTLPNSSMQFDFVVPFESYMQLNPNTLDWNYNTTKTYVMLRDGASVASFNQKIDDFLQDKREGADGVTLWARPFSDAYLYGNFEDGQLSGGRITYVRLFSIIAIFIVLIACINFTNLSTARATRRLKEVGVKKTIGARRSSLVVQYLSESVLLSVFSLCASILMVSLFQNEFNQITGKALSLFSQPVVIISLLGITLLTGLLAGAYPAFYLSGFSPLNILRGGGLSSKFNISLGDLLARRGLVIFQFTISVILMVAVLVVDEQIDFVQNKNLGYDKENILYFEREGRADENLETFLNELRQLPEVADASAIGQTIVGSGLNTFGIDDWEGKAEGVEYPAFEMRPVAHGMLELLDIGLLSGRSFSDNFSTEESKIIFNQAAIDVMGLEDPIGQKVFIGDTGLEIIGVTENFHFASLHEEIKPLFFVLRPSWTHKVMVKVNAGKEQEAITQLQDFYQDYNPEFPFDFSFLDQEYQVMYVAEQRVSILSRYFAGMAIVISCMGLFALSAFSAERRLKEIGIRKIMGASDLKIIQKLSGEFTSMVLIAIGVGLPISYFSVQFWLNDFAFSIELEWWYFGLSALAVLIIAWISVGYQTIKAASVNPVHCLKNE
jgi:ABC-type antimicrobial peptide transport system permease subunit